VAWDSAFSREADMGSDKLITVIVPQGGGMPLLRALHERGTRRAALGGARAPSTYTRGAGVLARTVRMSVEKDVLQVVVTEEEEEEIFNLLVSLAQIAETPGGFAHVGRVTRATAFTSGPSTESPAPPQAALDS
jgi:hypothetical protein